MTKLVNLASIPLESSDKSNSTCFVTHCPAVRMYIEKKYPLLKKYLDDVPSPLEVFSKLMETGSFCFLPYSKTQSQIDQFEDFTIDYDTFAQSSNFSAEQRTGILANYYTMSIQPCHDRKIEKIKGAAIDLVLTTNELAEYLNNYFTNQQLMSQNDNNYGNIANNNFSYTTDYSNFIKQDFYAYYFLEYYVQKNLQLPTILDAVHVMNQYGRRGSNKDMIIYDIDAGEVAPNLYQKGTMLKLIRVSGFRNLQNIANKFAYVESGGSQGLSLLQKKRAALMAEKQRAAGLPITQTIQQVSNEYVNYIVEFHACPEGCMFGAGQAHRYGETLYTTTVRAYETFNQVATADNSIVDETTCLISNIPTVVKITEQMLTPEEIAKERGVTGVMLKDLKW